MGRRHLPLSSPGWREIHKRMKARERKECLGVALRIEKEIGEEKVCTKEKRTRAPVQHY